MNKGYIHKNKAPSPKSVKEERALRRVSSVQHDIKLSISDLHALEKRLLAWSEHPKAVDMYNELHKVTKRLRGVL